MTREAFNPLFDAELRLNPYAAADLGETVATRGGVRGDSELLFLGNAANRPAKLLGDSKLIVTDRFMDAHGDQLEHEDRSSRRQRVDPSTFGRNDQSAARTTGSTGRSRSRPLGSRVSLRSGPRPGSRSAARKS